MPYGYYGEQKRKGPRLNLVTAPTNEPLTIDQVAQHARLGPAVTDDEINRWIKTARHQAESYLGKRLITQKWEYLWDYDWPGFIELQIPYPPLQSVESVKYIEQTTNQEITVASTEYNVSTSNGNYNAQPGIIQRVEGQVWPFPNWQIEAIKVTAICGYGNTAADIPDPIIHGMLLLIAHFDRMRSGYQKSPALPDGVRMEWDALRSDF